MKSECRASEGPFRIGMLGGTGNVARSRFPSVEPAESGLGLTTSLTRRSGLKIDTDQVGPAGRTHDD